MLIDPPRRGEIEARKTDIFNEQNELTEANPDAADTTAYQELETELDDLDDELGELVSVEIPIPADHCAALQHATAPADHQMRRVRVRLDDLAEAPTTGRLRLHLRTIAYWRGGTSIPQGNMVCIATQVQWAPKSTDQMNQVLIHELGHKIGMVPPGGDYAACDLDRPPNQYENRGHNGSHCHAGLGLLDNYRATREGMTCVMFGSTSGPTTFCGDCAPCVRRRDLGAGFVDF